MHYHSVLPCPLTSATPFITCNYMLYFFLFLFKSFLVSNYSITINNTKIKIVLQFIVGIYKAGSTFPVLETIFSHAFNIYTPFFLVLASSFAHFFGVA